MEGLLGAVMECIFNRQALILAGVPDIRSKWSVEVASRHSHTTRLSLRRVSLLGERRFRCKCHAGKGGIKLTKSTVSKPDHSNTSVTQVQDMDEEDRRR